MSMRFSHFHTIFEKLTKCLKFESKWGCQFSHFFNWFAVFSKNIEAYTGERTFCTNLFHDLDLDTCHFGLSSVILRKFCHKYPPSSIFSQIKSYDNTQAKTCPAMTQFCLHSDHFGLIHFFPLTTDVTSQSVTSKPVGFMQSWKSHISFVMRYHENSYGCGHIGFTGIFSPFQISLRLKIM